MTDDTKEKGNDNNNQQPVFQKGMTLEKLMGKFETKLGQQKAKDFEKKFEAKFKELDAAEAIAAGVRKELEKMWVEFNEGL